MVRQVLDLMVAFGPLRSTSEFGVFRTSTARPCLANRFLCWAAKIEKLDRPGKTMIFKWVWAGAELVVPNIAAQASAPSMRLRLVRMVDPSGFVVDGREV